MIPMATPMSAFFSAWGVVDTIASHSHNVAQLLAVFDNDQLLLGGGTGEHALGMGQDTLPFCGFGIDGDVPARNDDSRSGGWVTQAGVFFAVLFSRAPQNA